MSKELVFALAALKKANTANERIDNLPLPMVFKGTLGTGGTIENLPTASSANEGFVYIVITDGTYAGQTAKAGDTFVSDGSSWVLIPAGDEPYVIDDSVTSTALTWSSSKIASELGGILKSFTYTGTGSNPSVIALPDDINADTLVIGIHQNVTTNYKMDSFRIGDNKAMSYYLPDNYSSATTRLVSVSYDEQAQTLTLESQYSTYALNNAGDTYTVYYI